MFTNDQLILVALSVTWKDPVKVIFGTYGVKIHIELDRETFVLHRPAPVFILQLLILIPAPESDPVEATEIVPLKYCPQTLLP